MKHIKTYNDSLIGKAKHRFIYHDSPDSLPPSVQPDESERLLEREDGALNPSEESTERLKEIDEDLPVEKIDDNTYHITFPAGQSPSIQYERMLNSGGEKARGSMDFSQPNTISTTFMGNKLRFTNKERNIYELSVDPNFNGTFSVNVNGRNIDLKSIAIAENDVDLFAESTLRTAEPEPEPAFEAEDSVVELPQVTVEPTSSQGQRHQSEQPSATEFDNSQRSTEEVVREAVLPDPEPEPDEPEKAGPPQTTALRSTPPTTYTSTEAVDTSTEAREHPMMIRIREALKNVAEAIMAFINELFPNLSNDEAEEVASVAEEEGESTSEESSGETETAAAEGAEKSPEGISNEALSGIQLVLRGLDVTSGKDYVKKIQALMADIEGDTSGDDVPAQERSRIANIKAVLVETVQNQQRINNALGEANDGRFGTVIWLPEIGFIVKNNLGLAEFLVSDPPATTIEEFVDVVEAKKTENKNYVDKLRENARTSLQEYYDDESERVRMVINREQTFMDNAIEQKEASGWFGSVHRWITLSDPYAIEIRRSREKIAVMRDVAQEILTEAQQMLNADSPDLQGAVAKLDAVRRLTRRASRVDFDNEHFDLEQDSITVSRDVSIAAIISAGSIAGAAAGAVVGGTAAAGETATALTMQQTILQSGALAATLQVGSSLTTSIDDVERGAITAEDAWLRSTGEVGTAFVVGGATGGTLRFLGDKGGQIWTRLRSGVGRSTRNSGPRTGPRSSTRTGSRNKRPRGAGRSQTEQPRGGTRARGSENPRGGSRRRRGAKTGQSRGRSSPEAPRRGRTGNPEAAPSASFDPFTSRAPETMTVRQFLGLGRDATTGQIKQAARKLARSLHPDTLGSTSNEVTESNARIVNSILTRARQDRINPNMTMRSVSRLR